MRRIELLSQIGPSTLPSDIPVAPAAEPLILASVDDHIIEPPDLFKGRLPSKFEDQTPYVLEQDDGSQVWQLSNVREPQLGLSAVVGRPQEEWDRDPTRFEDMRPGCWNIDERIRDMDLNGVGVSANFPSALLGFCGSKFLQITDRDLAFALLQAYNDWHIEVWYGSYPHRIIPVQLPWLLDAELAAAEVRANATRGFKALSFCEDPAKLGLPSLWTRYWDPLFQACEDTGTVLCLHVASAGWNPTFALEAPPAMRAVHFMSIAMIAATDWLWSGIPTRFPNIKIAMSEGGVGWVPVLANRSDYVLRHSVSGAERRHWADELLPSEVLRRNFWFCLLDEPLTTDMVWAAGSDHLLVETDYPHADGTWPNSQGVMASRLGWLPKEHQVDITLRNATRIFELDEKAIFRAVLGDCHDGSVGQGGVALAGRAGSS